MDLLQLLINAVVGLLGGGTVVAILKFIASRKQQDVTSFNAVAAQLLNHIEELRVMVQTCEKEKASFSDQMEDMKAAITRLEDYTTTAVVIADEDGRVLEWNSGAVALFHWTTEDAIGRPVLFVMSPRCRQQYLNAFQTMKAEKRPPRLEPIRSYAITRDGQEFEVMVRVSSWQSGDKQLIAAEIRRRGSKPFNGH